jgi:RNA polymerase sporulation-specific sigma factor
MNRTDEELVALAQNGDRDAEEEILRRYKDMVRAKSRLYFMPGADSDDVVQEGMIAVFKAIGDYDRSKGSSFHTFANLCVGRRIITAVNAAARKKHDPLNSSVSLDMPISAGSAATLGDSLVGPGQSDPEAGYIFSEMIQLILSSNSKLFSPLERSVAERLILGEDYRTIAEKLGRSPKSADNAIQRIRAKLKAFMLAQ